MSYTIITFNRLNLMRFHKEMFKSKLLNWSPEGKPPTQTQIFTLVQSNASNISTFLCRRVSEVPFYHPHNHRSTIIYQWHQHIDHIVYDLLRPLLPGWLSPVASLNLDQWLSCSGKSRGISLILPWVPWRCPVTFRSNPFVESSSPVWQGPWSSFGFRVSGSKGRGANAVGKAS